MLSGNEGSDEMARPIKEGLDYFELDCQLDDKIKLIQAEFGLKGFAVVVKLYQKIYGTHGYYCEWNEDVLLLFMSENGLSGDSKNLIEDIVSACVRRNIFSEELYAAYQILSSSGIQKRYVNAISKRVNVKLKKEYLLIDVDKNIVFSDTNQVSDVRNTVNDRRNSQSREEKKRVDESREENMDSIKDTACPTEAVGRIIDEWNSLSSVGIKGISKINKGTQREKWLSARLKQYSENDFMLAIENIRRSGFLQGSNKNGWMITFDWFIRPNNFPKVLEGNYNNGGTSYQQRQSENGYRQAYNQGMTGGSKLEQFAAMAEEWVNDG